MSDSYVLLTANQESELRLRTNNGTATNFAAGYEYIYEQIADKSSRCLLLPISKLGSDPDFEFGL